MVSDYINVFSKVSKLVNQAINDGLVVSNIDINEDIVKRIFLSQGKAIRQAIEDKAAIIIPKFGTFAIKEGREDAIRRTKELKKQNLTKEEITEKLNEYCREKRESKKVTTIGRFKTI